MSGTETAASESGHGGVRRLVRRLDANARAQASWLSAKRQRPRTRRQRPATQSTPAIHVGGLRSLARPGFGAVRASTKVSSALLTMSESPGPSAQPSLASGGAAATRLGCGLGSARTLSVRAAWMRTKPEVRGGGVLPLRGASVPEYSAQSVIQLAGSGGRLGERSSSASKSRSPAPADEGGTEARGAAGSKSGISGSLGDFGRTTQHRSVSAGATRCKARRIQRGRASVFGERDSELAAQLEIAVAGHEADEILSQIPEFAWLGLEQARASQKVVSE